MGPSHVPGAAHPRWGLTSAPSRCRKGIVAPEAAGQVSGPSCHLAGSPLSRLLNESVCDSPSVPAALGSSQPL